MTEMKSMREEMAAIATEARNKLAEVTDETPEERAAEIEREFDAMMADHDKLAARVEREDRVAKAFKKLEVTDTTREVFTRVKRLEAIMIGASASIIAMLVMVLTRMP